MDCVIQGNAEEKLKEIESESVDMVLTDPPYGYSFMGKDWDKALPSIGIWKECLRVLKAGSFAFVMSAPRQDVMSRMIVSLGDAGFVTNFTPIFWNYHSGFPKAANISKLIDKKLGKSGKKNPLDGYTPVSEEAKRLDGAYAGFQPKPAVEVILVVMKPLDKNSYVEQAMDNGKGVTWLDDCRIPFAGKRDIGNPHRFRGLPWLDDTKGWNKNDLINNCTVGEKGRFPANLLVSDDCLNNGEITKSSGGVRKPSDTNTVYGEWNDGYTSGVDDEGSFSRYYDLDKWEAQFIITPKPSTSEKERGLDMFMDRKVNDGRKVDADVPFQRGKTERKNIHPTVKPVLLMKYLVMMGSREKDMVLDPFLGSGTSGIACEMLRRRWIGIELNEEYVEIAKARLNGFRKDRLDMFLGNDE